MLLEMRTRITDYAFYGVILAALSIGSYLLFSAKNEALGARVMHHIEIVPVELAAGQTFHVKADETLRLLCPFEIRWSLISTKDHVEKVRVIENVRPAHPQTGRFTYENAHFIPPNVPPGAYDYSVQIFDNSPGHTYLTTFTSPLVIITGATP